MADGLHGYRVPEALRRRERVACSFTRDELADLRGIAEAWGVTPALVVWSLVAEALAECRAEAPQLGQSGLAISAALRVLRQSPGVEVQDGDSW